jgi:hypothetical protein
MYPKGYIVPEGERGHYHVMFVDIISKPGEWPRGRAMMQKFFPVEWDRIKRAIEGNSVGVTGHNEFVIIHDPTVKKPEPKPEQEVKPESGKKPVKGRAKAAPQNA